MQEKSFFLVKNQQVVSWKNGRGRGLTGNEEIIAWNYRENRQESGGFFETPVELAVEILAHLVKAFLADAQKKILRSLGVPPIATHWEKVNVV